MPLKPGIRTEDTADEQPRANRNGTRRRAVLPAALLLLLVVSAYLPALRNGFIWDDDTNVTNNPVLTQDDGLRRIWTDLRANEQYYPLTHTSFWLERRAFGLRPFGYHLDNVLLHAGSSVLLWRILAFLGVPGAWFAAAVFALHPVHAESVAWVTERKNTLSGFFMMLSVFSFVHAHLRAERDPEARKARAGQLLPLGFFLAALLSKTAVCLLPFGLAAIVWWRRGRIIGRDFRTLLPFVALGSAFGLLTAWLEQSHVGASGSEFTMDFATRFLIAGRAWWFYVFELFWPADLVFVRPRWDIKATDPMAWLFPAAVLLALAVLVLWRRRTGRGPLAAVAWYSAMIFPALGFFNVYFMRYAFVQDHFQYHASAGILAAAAGSAAWWWEKGRRKLTTGASGALRVVLPLIVLAPLWWLTWRQTHIYRDNETLWKDTLVKNPAAFVAHSNYGLLLFERGDLSAALEHQRTALVLHPGWEEYYNLANTLARLGRIEEAIDCYRASIEQRPTAAAYTNMGIELQGVGRPAEGIAAYREALRLEPRFFLAHFNLGLDLLKQGAFAEALPSLRTAVLLAPDVPAAHQNLGVALGRLGLEADAKAEFSTAALLRSRVGRQE
ncbi:MAG TPA: tetratricopeptide repeat protein [bacterium]